MAVFQDHVIVVTGASEGIGRALCLELASQNPKLVLASRNEQRLLELKNQVETKGTKALAVMTDVTEESSCKNLIDQTISKWGRLDVLINNAGITMWTLFEDIKDTSIFEKLMRVNYLGSVLCTYYALPFLKNSKGRIVGVASVAGITGVPTRTAYCASKHAMFGFFDALRVELQETGVSVTMVAPDFVLSEIHRRALGNDGKPLGKSPLQEGKIMTAEECAKLMVPAIENRERLLLTSNRAKLGRFMKLFAPGLVDYVAAKAIQDKK